jgi:hypothetical protein
MNPDDLDAVIALFVELGMELEGKGPVGEVAQYEDVYRLCYVRGPEGIVVGLAEPLRE